jgi:putative endonuclease
MSFDRRLSSMTTSEYPPHSLGARGEALARECLEGRGWEVLAQNVRFGRREVDLVVRKRDLIAFVEVKTRTGRAFGVPELAVNLRKRREIELVAADFLFRMGLPEVDVRFDVVAVEVDTAGRTTRLEHIEDAWRPGWR